MRHSMHRRRFLRGLAGTTMALPFLEAFAPRPARAGATPTTNYAFLFAGFSIGSQDDRPQVVPADGAWNGQVTRAFQPLADEGVQDNVTLVTGLEIPVGSEAPAAGRPPVFHSTSHQVLTTGQRFDNTMGGRLAGPSSDWVAAKVLGLGAAQPVLAYRAQPAFYYGDSSGYTDGIISARVGADGEMEDVAPVTSPRVAFESLFSGFVPPDPSQAPEALRLLALRRSVVDLVATDAEALIKRIGAEDRTRMERHFDELRALESRLDDLELPDTASCQMFRNPGEDPPLGDTIDPNVGGGDYNDYFEGGMGYSNEDLRAEIMADLIHMSFACGISRVASFMITYAQCFLNMHPALGLASDLHEITHGSVGGGDDQWDALADCAAWHTKFYARLVRKLGESVAPDGTPLLDNTAVVLAFEGGWGFDLESGGASSPHSTENMMMLVGGNAGDLHTSRPGGHIRGEGRHPAAVLNTVLQQVGVDETMGEVTDTVDELLG